MREIEIGADNPPSGYVPLEGRCEGEHYTGPYFICAQGSSVKLGFRVAQRHLNRMGVCHGGMLATFADIQGTAICHRLGLANGTPTISLSLDYVAPVKLGDWVESAPELVKLTGRMIFFRALVTANGAVALRVNGIYRRNLTRPVEI